MKSQITLPAGPTVALVAAALIGFFFGVLPEPWNVIATVAAIALAFWILSAPVNCCLCKEPAVLECGEYPLCRKCWDRVDRDARFVEQLHTNNAAIREVEKWIKEHPEK